MKINYIARINPFSPTATGGGEAVMSDLLRFGAGPFGPVKKLAIITPDTEIEYMDDADLNIFADVYNLPGLNGFSDEQIETYSKIQYIHFSNAYVDICSHDYLQCDVTDGCNKKGIELMSGAKLLYFVSPLHAKTVFEAVPSLVGKEYKILRPTINTDMFTNKHFDDRNVDYIYVGPMLAPKGILNVLQYLHENDADPESCMFVGANPKRYDFSKFKHVERIPYQDMPFVMNKAKCLIHLPVWPEPMGRIVIEAALCGCNLVVNENVGATSFGFDDITDPANYEGAIEEFWKNVTDVIR